MAEPLNIDVAGATAALEAADPNGAMPAITQGNDPFQQAAAEHAAPAPNTPPAAEAPAAETTTPPETVAAPDFTSIPDDVLTPEMLQMKRSMQADYTRKTQEIAPWRKLGDELGLQSPEDFRAAGEVYQRLSDPRNWPTIHSELTEYMTQAGMTPAAASAAASDQLAQFAPETPAPDFGEADPSVAPLLQQMQAQSQQIQQLTQLVTQDRQAREQQEQWHAAAQRLTDQENSIRTANPHYTDQDIQAIYSMMGNDGNLDAAQQQFESVIGSRVAQYIASKSGAQQGAPAPVPGGQVLAQPVTTGPLTLDQGHAAAMAHVAALERQGQ